MLEVRRFGVGELQTYHRNPRRGDVKAIAESLRVRGQYRPIVVNLGTRTGRPLEVLAGNHTLLAARALGWESIEATTVDVDDDGAAQIVVADNRLADLGEYDEAELARLLADLDSLEGTGFSDQDVASMMAALEEPVALTDVDDVPDLPESEPVSRLGDVWELGPHRLVCGDATDESVLRLAVGSGRADVMWTDPPYGVEYVGGTKDALTIQNDGAAGLPGLLDGAFAAAAGVLRAGAPVYVAHADSGRVTFEGALRGAGFDVRQNLVWVKNALVLGRSDYHYQHEPVLYGLAPYEPDHEPILYGFADPTGVKGRLGRGGPRWFGDNRQTTVFTVPKPKRSAEHPTMKPVELIVPMLRNSLPAGGLVLDMFAGSGSTLIAAHHVNGRAALVELDPRYVDVICRRWQEHTGVMPVRGGESVDFVA